MLEFKIVTIYPEFFDSFLRHGLIKRALESRKIAIDTINLRAYGLGKHLKVDGAPYGGGAGMLLRPEPVVEALEECEKSVSGDKMTKVLLSPQGVRFTQDKAEELSRSKLPIVLVCGRFEGFDERIRDFVDEEISIGDYLLQGGEVAAMTIVESVGRLVPGVVGNRESLHTESFKDSLLEYAQYTKPMQFRGIGVPEVLVSGNHRKIAEWRRESAYAKTRTRRGDLLK